MKDELQNIISGKSKVRHGEIIQTIACYLKRSQDSSELVEDFKLIKNKETEKLIFFINKKSLWYNRINFENFVSEGAEQRVYLKSGKKVIKLNDSIYYSSWYDYFVNLLLNNYFFPDTAYNLIGFYMHNEILYAVVEQAFVKADSKTNLENVKIFLNQNGFENTKNHDYLNKELGIILEDLHDENVLTKNENLFFIDTVFYLTKEFYRN